MMDTKPFWMSKTQWGIILAALMTVFGKAFEKVPGLIDWLANPETAQAFATLGTLVSLIYAAYGRFKAETKVTIK